MLYITREWKEGINGTRAVSAVYHAGEEIGHERDANSKCITRERKEDEEVQPWNL